MNIALITAGGVGLRFHPDTPKQFASFLGKPMIIYTLEKFEKNPLIDLIAVVCLSGWEDFLRRAASDYSITKLAHIVPGGASNQQSIRNGILELRTFYKPEDLILIHDAVRPLVSQKIIDQCIDIARQKGNAVACLPCLEPLLRSEADGSAKKYHPRTGLMRAQAPQAFRLVDMVEAHRFAEQNNINDTVASCELMQMMGHKIFFAPSNTFNLKVTFPEDGDLLLALLQAQRHHDVPCAK